jgi:hypothetical protein
MRMTASWLDPAIGSAEPRRGARSLRTTLVGSPQIVLSLLAQAKRHRPDAPRACRRALAGPEVAWKRCRTLNGLSDGHP